jgi:L-threonylcarbamoyladenylate synthase
MEAEVYDVDATHPMAAAIDRAVGVLKAGGLVLFPSDTVYVLASLARTGSTVSGGLGRLFALKNRGRGPSFPWLVPDAASLDVYGTDVTQQARALAGALWPGGLAVVVRASSAVPRVLAREDGTVSLRCSASPISSGLIRACGLPLVSTGAAPHGQAAPCEFSGVEADVLSAVDFAIRDERIVCPGRSTIIDCTTREPRVLREGIVSHDQIKRALGMEVSLV